MSTDADLIRNRITDESIELMRNRVGYPNPTIRTGVRQLPWWTVTSPDAIRHHTNGYGDDNPLYCDAAYGRGTRWGGQIAPPGFVASGGPDATTAPRTDGEEGDDEPVAPGQEEDAWYRRLGRRMPDHFDRATRGALRGVQLYASGTDTYYFAPAEIGDYTAGEAGGVYRVEDKQSEFAGRSAIVNNKSFGWNQRGEITTMSAVWLIHAERKKVTSENKYAADEPAFYTDEQLAAIEAAYDGEYRRGPDTWYFEDVEVGAALPTMVKGPMTVTDMINQHMGSGWFGYGNPALRLGYENRKRMRGFYTRNKYNAWDVVQRVHWEHDMAKEVGVPLMYDIAPMRMQWVIHYCTNLMGDDGWLYYVHTELRRFNYFGDTTWLTATVTNKHETDELGPAIDIEIVGTNQRGTENCRATATLLVPSRRGGPVVLPQPPAPLAQKATQLFEATPR